jgi:hypothetical protein
LKLIGVISFSWPFRRWSSRIFLISLFAATWRGVFPFLSAIFILAPDDKRVFKISICPFSDAIWRGVLPSLLAILISAPNNKRVFTISI